MNTGVEILLKRMETHPEDFDYNLVKNMSRWYRLVDHALADELTTEEEEKALKDMLFKLRRDRFTEMVMRELAGVEDETSEQGKSLTSSIGTGGVTLGTWASPTTTLTSNSLTLGNTTLSEAGLKQMLATHKAMREETKPKHWWNKSIPELLGKK